MTGTKTLVAYIMLIREVVMSIGKMDTLTLMVIFKL